MVIHNTETSGVIEAITSHALQQRVKSRNYKIFLKYYSYITIQSWYEYDNINASALLDKSHKFSHTKYNLCLVHLPCHCTLTLNPALMYWKKSIVAWYLPTSSLQLYTLHHQHPGEQNKITYCTNFQRFMVHIALCKVQKLMASK
jgi:hypothetical protein